MRVGIAIFKLGNPFLAIGVVGESSRAPDILDPPGSLAVLAARVSIAGGSIGRSFSTGVGAALSVEIWDSAVTKEDPEDETNDETDFLADGAVRWGTFVGREVRRSSLLIRELGV